MGSPHIYTPVGEMARDMGGRRGGSDYTALQGGVRSPSLLQRSYALS